MRRLCGLAAAALTAGLLPGEPKVVYPTYRGSKKGCRTWPAGFEGFAGHSQPPQNPDLRRSVGGWSARSRFLSVLGFSRLHQ